jgi:serine/threonine protein kinase
VVKLAERKADGVMVVVKQINLSCMSPKEIADAQREVSILSQFDHANIIKYLDCVVDEVNPTPNTLFFVLRAISSSIAYYRLWPPTLPHMRTDGRLHACSDTCVASTAFPRREETRHAMCHPPSSWLGGILCVVTAASSRA